MWYIIGRILLFVWVIFSLTACISSDSTPTPEPLIVSAASSLNLAFEEIGTRYEQETGQVIVFNFGSTGQLAQQIDQGAPVDLFAAANVSFIEYLAANNRILSNTIQIYGQGRITLWTQTDAPFTVTTIDDLLSPNIQRIALANPMHAPYGIAAREALQTAGVWETLQPKLVLAENVRQTLQFAETGNVDVAIVALSLSLTSDGRWELIPAMLHVPIDQALAIVADSPHQDQARQFAAFIGSPSGRSIMRKYGFLLAGEKLDFAN